MFRRLLSGCRRFTTGTGGGGDDVSRPLPYLMLPPTFPSRREVVYNLYSPVERDVVNLKNSGGTAEAILIGDSRTRWVGSSHGWLAVFNSGDISLLNPISGRLIDLPPYRGKPFMEAEENAFPAKVILSHSPDEDEESCRAVMILGSLDRSAFCCPGRSEEWTPMGRWHNLGRARKTMVLGDSVYWCAGRRFMVSVRDQLEVCRTEWIENWIHPSMDELRRTVSAPRWHRSDPGFEWHTFLVEEEVSGSRFLVRRFLIDRKVIDYKVYKFPEHEGEEMELCKDLDGLIMFVGINHSFAVKGSKFPELKPNTIHFSGPWYFDYQTTDLFDYDTKEFSPYFPDDAAVASVPGVLPWMMLSLVK